MIEILLQDSYAEWSVPLTILIIWIFSLVIISLFRLVNRQNHYQNIKKEKNFLNRQVYDEPSTPHCLQFIKMVRRKLCPDDGDEHVHLLF